MFLDNFLAEMFQHDFGSQGLPKMHVTEGQKCVSFCYSASIIIQCPLDKATLDIAAALPIATSIAVTNLRQYINSDLGYNDFEFQFFCSKITTVNCFEVAISNDLNFYRG